MTETWSFISAPAESTGDHDGARTQIHHRRSADEALGTYRHTSEKRTNIPPAKIAGEGEIPKVKRVQYAYNPHLPPALRFDPTGKADRTLASLHGTLDKLPLKAAERETIYGGRRRHQPWLEWAGKREEHERGFFEVDPVALHIHERVSAQACVRMATREDVQRDLFADPELPYKEAVKFYRHDVDWANRLILGDSLQVMSSLARRENLAGKVQMIYMTRRTGSSSRAISSPRSAAATSRRRSRTSRAKPRW